MINEHKKGVKAKKYAAKPRNPVGMGDTPGKATQVHKNPKDAITQPRKAKHKNVEMAETVISIIGDEKINEGWKGALAGGTAGTLAGELAGTAVMPGIGTAVGGALGGTAGMMIGDKLGGEEETTEASRHPLGAAKAKFEKTYDTPDKMASYFRTLSGQMKKSPEEVARSKAWSHGYGKMSPHYWLQIQDYFDDSEPWHLSHDHVSEAGRYSNKGYTQGFADPNAPSLGSNREFKRAELQHELGHERNNLAVYINGKLWKVFPGKGTADSPEERSYLNGMRKWAENKSSATGKKWEVSLTGANPTNEDLSKPQGVSEDIIKEDRMGLGSDFEPQQHADPEGNMARSELYRNAKYAMDLLKMIEPEDDIEPWIAANLTNAATWLDKVYHYLDYRGKFDPDMEIEKDDKGIKESDAEPSGDIARMNLQEIVEYSMKLFQMIKPETRLDGWVAMKLTKASECVSSSKHYLEHMYFEKHSSDMYENMLLKQLAQRLSEDERPGFFKSIIDHARKTAGVSGEGPITSKSKKTTTKKETPPSKK